MDIQEILQQVSPEEGARLKVLHNANLVTLKAYSSEPSKKNLENWQAAEAAYTTELAKYAEPEQPAAGVPAAEAVSWHTYQDTKVKKDVWRFLVAAGYEVTERTFYRHCDYGKLHLNGDGLFTRKLVKKYATEYLVPPAGDESAEGLEAQRLRAQVTKLNDEIDRGRFNDARERGKYILREDIDRENAARAVVLDSGTENLFRSKAREWCVLVGGDMARAPELVDVMLAGWHELLNRYASTEEFTVEFEIGEEG